MPPMKVATIKEAKTEEYRVALTPAGVAALRERGHQVLIEHSAGEGSGFADEDYSAAGARLFGSPADAVSATGARRPS